MAKSLKKWISAKCGVAATEFALLAPVLLLILLGMVDYGLFINTAIKLESTARAAAEYVLQGGDEDLIMDDIIEPSNLQLSEDALASLDIESEFVCECADAEEVLCTGSCGSGDYVRRFIQVRLEMDYDTIFPYPGIQDTMTLRGYVRLQAN